MPQDDDPFIDLVFEGPTPEASRFTEVRDSAGRPVAGQWRGRTDGDWALRIALPRPAGPIDLGKVLADLYASEINAQLKWFWDCGVDLLLGDEMNGFKARGQVRSPEQAGAWLIEHAIAFYPDSLFARLYRQFTTGPLPTPVGPDEFLIPATAEARKRGCTCQGFDPEGHIPPIDTRCPLHGLAEVGDASASRH